ncbi:PKD domain-containing protein [Chitinophaga agri]|nr:PKD domain-containing protein [Chitinophaga agri]
MFLNAKVTRRVATSCAVLWMLLFLCVAAHGQLTADFTPTKTSDCENLITKFIDNSTGTPVSWQWDLGNGFTSTEQSPSASYTTPGNYNVTLTVKNAAGNTSTAVKTVTVWEKPVPDFTAGPAKGCVPFDVTFTDRSNPVNGTISTWSWDFGDGTTASGNSPVHTYNNALSPTVTLTVTNSNGCTASKQISNVVDVSAALTADFSISDKFLCTAPGVLTVTNAAAGPGNLTCAWDFGDGSNAAGADPGTHTYATKGVYKVKLTVTSDKGCTATKTSEEINVANFTSDFQVPASSCDNSTAIFNAMNSPLAGSITWSTDKGYIYGSDVTASYQPAGAGTVKVTMTANYGQCQETVTKDYVVKASPVADFTTDQQAICDVPATIKLTDKSQGATSWTWDFGNGQSSALQHPSVVYNSLGYYNIRLTAINAAGCSSVTDRYVNVVKPEVYVYTSVAQGCEGMSTAFSSYISTNDSIVGFEWNFGDGSPVSTEATPSHTYDHEGTYPVTLTYTTANGCKGSVNLSSYYAIRIYRKPKPDFSSPEAPQICGNNWVHFNATTDVGNEWAWDFGDNSGPGYLQNDVHSYRAPGTYDVTLTVSNYGCNTTITKPAYITAVNPFPRFSMQPVDCNNRTVMTFDEQSTGTINSWTWNWGDGKENSYTTKTSPVTHQFDKTGMYMVRLTVTDGTCTSTDSLNIHVYAPSPITITSDKTTMCTNETMVAGVTAMDRSIYSYSYAWYASDGTPADWYNYNFEQASFTNMQPGKDTVRFIAYNLQGCPDTSNRVIVDVHGPAAAFLAPDLQECRGTALTFTDQTDISKGKPVRSWSWDFGDGSPAKLFTAPPFTYTYDRSGYFYPKLTVTDQDGCTSTAAGPSVQVNGPNADFMPSAAWIPPGGDVSFYNYTTVTGGTATYTWDFGDQTSSTEYSPNKHYPDKGLYTVKLMVKDNNGCTDTARQQIKVSSVIAAFTFTTEFVNNSGCPPVIARFTNTSVNYTNTYWDFGDGSFSTISDPSHTYTHAGKYTVKLKVQGGAGTEDEYEQEVEVKGPYATIATSANGGCLTREIAFTVDATAAVNFAWDFTDGIVMETTDAVIRHTFKEPGIYHPRLILSDQAGCKGTAFLEKPIVIDKLDVQLNAAPALICDKGWVSFTPVFNSYSIDGLKETATYKWTYETGVPAEQDTTAEPRFYLDKIQPYTFTLTTTTAYGCVQTVSKTIHAYSRPELTITGPAQACQDAPVTLGGTVTKENDITWKWDFGNGNTGTVPLPADQSYTTVGPAEVTLIGMSNEGCSDTARHSISILPKPVVNAVAGADFICKGNTTTLSAGGGVSYEWLPARYLSDAHIAAPVASPRSSTTYQVTVTDANGCKETDDVSIRVVEPFTIQATPDTVLCLGQVLPLWVTGADHYVWKGEGLDNATSPYPKATINAVGNYTYQVTAYDADGCFTKDTSLAVRVHALPTVHAGADRIVMAGTPVRLGGESSPDVVKWEWTPAEYLDCATCATPEAIPNLSTTYMVTAENRYGCSATDEVFVKVTCDKGAVFLPTAFSPNRDGKNEWFYPKGRGVKEVVSMRMYDRWGSLVFERDHFQINSATAGWDGTWKGQIAPVGTYVYAIETMCEDGTTFLFRGVVTVVR